MKRNTNCFRMQPNCVNTFFNQQNGFEKWTNINAVIPRFECRRENNYFQLLASNDDDDFIRDTPIFACKFASQKGSEHLVALANEDGKLAVHNSNNNTRFGIQAHNNAIFDLAWMFDKMKIVTASGDHTAKLYDVNNGEIREEKTFYGHSRSVKTVAFRTDDSSVFATGGRDGNILLWDTRTDVTSFIGKADRTIANSHICRTYTPSKSKRKIYTPNSSGIKSVTGLVFQEENTLISCGAGDGVIKIWDLRKSYCTYKKEAIPKNKIPYAGNTSKNGFSSLIIDRAGVKLYANCLDNIIYCYNVATYNPEPVMKYTGHQNSTFYIKASLSRDGNYLVSGSSDEMAYIWNTKSSKPLVKLVGHHAEVTCVAWCDYNNCLVTCSDDMSHKLWTIGSQYLLENWEILLKGRCEVMPIANSPCNKLKRKLEFLPDTTPKKSAVECIHCKQVTNGLKDCENCQYTLKRKNSSEMVNENKRLQTEFGPRRLFANLTQNIANIEGLNLDDVEPKPNNRLLDGLKEITSPTTSKNKDNCPSSPTVNLPNFVVDGTAPHLNYSPQKRKSQDWLTKMRIEMNLRKQMQERAAGPSQPKMPKLDSTPSSKSSGSPKSPLLRFFKVTNSTKCEGHCSNKSHNCNNFFSSSPKSSQ